MFSEYTTLVLNCYRTKLANGHLNLNLQHPTPANLKRECLWVLENRGSKSDFTTLAQFFGERENKEGYALAIRAFYTPNFKPLQRFLKNKVENTDEKNIELLAWLLDFRPRPYKYGMKLEDCAEEQSSNFYSEDLKPLDETELEITGAGGELLQTKPEGQGPVQVDPDWKTSKWLRYAAIIVLFITGVLLLLTQKESLQGSMLPFINSGKQCMYWNGSRYIESDCVQNQSSPVLAKEIARLTSFQRITRTDTITAKDIGKVWYVKIDNKLELFTGAGYHPDYPSKPLKLLTPYMFNKYLAPAEISSNR